MRKTVTLILVFFLCLTSSGCWDRREIDEIGIVTYMAVDYDLEKEKYLLTSCIIRPAEVAIGLEEGLPGRRGPNYCITSMGDSIFQANKRHQLRSPRTVFHGHTVIVAIGEETARQGLKKVVDYLSREVELRLNLWIAVVEGDGKDLCLHAQFEELLSSEITQIILRQREFSLIYDSSLKEVLDSLNSEGIEPVLTKLEIIEDPLKPEEIQDPLGIVEEEGKEKEDLKREVVQVRGAAYFKGDSLAGFLDEKETNGLLWLQDKMGEVTLVIKDPPGTPGRFTVDKIKGRAEIKPLVEGEDMTFLVKVKSEGNLIDYIGEEDFVEPEIINILEDKLSKIIKDEILTVVNTAQEQETDFLGLGRELHRNNPETWKKVKENWEEIFPQVKVEVEVDTAIRRIGLTTEPPDYN